MTLRTSIPSLLREARNRGALSQRALADFAGTAQSVVGRIEAGLTSPTVETVSQLFEAAGFDLKMEIVPRQIVDPVIEAYKPGIDRTLLVENLRRSVDEGRRSNAEGQALGDD